MKRGFTKNDAIVLSLLWRRQIQRWINTHVIHTLKRQLTKTTSSESQQQHPTNKDEDEIGGTLAAYKLPETHVGAASPKTLKSQYDSSATATGLWVLFRCALPRHLQNNRYLQVAMAIAIQLETRTIPREVFSCFQLQWIAQVIGKRYPNLWWSLKLGGMAYASHVFHNPNNQRSLGSTQTHMGRLLDYPCLSSTLSSRQQQNTRAILTQFAQRTPVTAFRVFRYYLFLFSVIRRVFRGKRPIIDRTILYSAIACSASAMHIRTCHLISGMTVPGVTHHPYNLIQGGMVMHLSPKWILPPQGEMFFHYALGNGTYACLQSTIAKYAPASWSTTTSPALSSYYVILLIDAGMALRYQRGILHKVWCSLLSN